MATIVISEKQYEIKLFIDKVSELVDVACDAEDKENYTLHTPYGAALNRGDYFGEMYENGTHVMLLNMIEEVENEEEEVQSNDLYLFMNLDFQLSQAFYFKVNAKQKIKRLLDKELCSKG